MRTIRKLPTVKRLFVVVRCPRCGDRREVTAGEARDGDYPCAKCHVPMVPINLVQR